MTVASLATVAAVLDLLGTAAPLPAARQPLETASGGVLREPLLAPSDLPAFDRSSVDGFAVRRDDPGPRFRVVGELRAGDWPRDGLQRGEAIRVGTGAAVPPGDVQVILQEHVGTAAAESGAIEVLQRSDQRNIRCRGEDLHAGDLLLAAGTRLHAGTLSCLAACGQTEPLLTRPIQILHLATGNELVSPAEQPGPGQIRDSNSTLVAAFVRGWRVELHQDRVPEDERPATERLQGAISQRLPPDLVLLSGGASVGPHDVAAELLRRLGYKLLVRQVAMRPGKPLVIGRAPWGWAMALPGNPLSHLVALQLFLRRLLDALSGLPLHEPFEQGVLGAALANCANPRETFWPARRLPAENLAGPIRLLPQSWSSSGDLRGLTADALIRIPVGTDALAQGTPVQFVRAD